VAPPRDPLAGIRTLVVDGSNLAHALAHGQGAGPAPRAAVLGRIRAAIPAEVAIELVFDGPPEPGAVARIGRGMTVRYGGRRPADALVIERVLVEAESAPGAVSTLVVTDDGELRRAAAQRGASTARTAGLIARMERGRLSAPSAGNPRPPMPEPELPDRPGWRPGRGATAKRGNPRRRPRSDRPR
jgi:hypothetical protein